MVWWCKSARRDEWAKSVLRRRKARLRPGNSLVYPQKTPEFRQFYAVMEWCRLWPKWNGGGGGIRTNGMICVPLCFFGVFSALQALRNPAPNALFVVDFRAQGSGTVVRSRNGTGPALRPPGPGSYPYRAWGGGRPRKGRGPETEDRPMTKRTPNKTRPRPRAKKKSAATSAQTSDAARRPSGKLGLIVARLERTAGATIEELVDATGWQKHSVHGALSRLRSAGFAIRLELTAGRKDLSARTGRGVSHAGYGNPHCRKPGAR